MDSQNLNQFCAKHPKTRPLRGAKNRRIYKKQPTNSSIVDEFLGLCEASDKDRTDSSSRKRAEALPKKSPQDEFDTKNPK